MGQGQVWLTSKNDITTMKWIVSKVLILELLVKRKFLFLWGTICVTLTSLSVKTSICKENSVTVTVTTTTTIIIPVITCHHNQQHALYFTVQNLLGGDKLPNTNRPHTQNHTKWHTYCHTYVHCSGSSWWRKAAEHQPTRKQTEAYDPNCGKGVWIRKER